MNSYMQRFGVKVIQKYGSRCWYCGVHLGLSHKATIDHFMPQKYGGSDDIDNLRLACRPCNARKSCSDIETFRLRERIKKANLPKFISTPVLKYFEIEHGFTIELPRHEFYFENREILHGRF